MNPINHLKVALILLPLIFAACGRDAETSVADQVEPVAVVELVAQADAAFKGRAETAKLREGLQLLRRARVADSHNFDVAWKIAQFDYFLAERLTEGEARDKALKEGINAGKAAIKLKPNAPEGYFWTGANLGVQAQSDVISGATNISEVRENMRKVIEIEPGYYRATAFVALAEIELKTRGMLGGDAQKAVELLEQALSIEKQNSLIYLSLAEAYLALKRKPEARKMLDEVAKMPRNDEFAPERRVIEEKAKKLESKF